MPVMFGSVTFSIAAIAIAASTALPPFFRTSRPTCDASGWLDATMACGARATDRPGATRENQSGASGDGAAGTAAVDAAGGGASDWRHASAAMRAANERTMNGKRDVNRIRSLAGHC